MKKYSSIILFLFAVICIVGIRQYNAPKVEVNVASTAKVDEPLIFDIQTSVKGKPVDCDKLQVNFYHKYKKDEVIDETLTPYENGKYELVYFPQYAGEYLGTVTAEVNGQTLVKQLDVTVS